ncbi:MAG: tRNA uridine-5-carboxymethylaminomethyl(34) synthesis GTPase MnmE [Candidatus Latescibacterota bacterium]
MSRTFTMRDPISDKTTIAAVATPQGSGGISIVKISGPDSLSLAESIFRGVRSLELHEREMIYGKIVVEDNTIDEALVCFMKSPRSYTGEDVVEIQTHGGRVAAAEILDIILRKGAEPAGPGEFTRRAFLNGKIDLVQAEAVRQITESESRLALRCAERMHEGCFSREIGELIDRLSDNIAALEMNIDFSDQHEGGNCIPDIRESVDAVRNRIAALLRTAQGSKYVQHGFRTVITGKVNAGKSSLFNLLLGKKRAIVNSCPGTTRDWIEEKMEIEGILFDLLDTAGLRETGDEVERMGVQESKRLIHDADIILYVAGPEEELPEDIPAHAIPVAGKSDLIRMDSRTPDILYVSSLTGEGIEACRSMLVTTARKFLETNISEGLFLLDRHRAHLENALRRLELALDSLNTWSEEITVLELSTVIGELSMILGRHTSPDILDAVFRNFCIGK